MKKYYILGGLALVAFLVGMNYLLTSGADVETAVPAEQTSGGYSGMGK